MDTTDCCDGSDEYASGAACPTGECQRRMQSFQAERADQLRALEDGQRDRRQLMERAKKLLDEAEASAKELEARAEQLRAQLEQLEARAAEEERLEAEERDRQVADKQDVLLRQLGLDQLTQRQLATLVLDMARSRIANSDDTVSLIRSAREQAAAGTEEQSLKDPTQMDDSASAYKKREDTRRRETKRIEREIESRRKKKEQREKEAEEARAKAEAEGAEVPTPEPAPAEEEEEEPKLPEEEAHPLDVLLDALAESKGFSRAETTAAREARDEVEKQLSTEEKSLEDAKNLLFKSYGPDNVFLALKDECVESAGGAYKYKICFFGKATQDHTSLGTMKDLPSETDETEKDQEDVDPYRLEFTQGTKCWNGPHRSLTVDVVCGPLPMELYEVEEPSTCVYKGKLRAPLACDEQHRAKIMAPPADVARAAAATPPHHIEFEVPAVF